jgi:hypothetical protein
MSGDRDRFPRSWLAEEILDSQTVRASAAEPWADETPAQRHPARSITDRAVEWYAAFHDLWGNQRVAESGDLGDLPGHVPLFDADDDEDTLPGSKAVARYQASMLTPVEPARLGPDLGLGAGVRLVGYPSVKPPPAAPAAPPEAAQSDSSMYARLRLRHDYLAKLWVYGLTPRDVVVWSPERQCWVPMLLVRPLREAVLDLLEAHEGHPQSLTCTRQSAADLGVDSLLSAPALDAEPLPGPGASSTIPPTVVTARPPEIPRSPKVPDFGDAGVRTRITRLVASIGARQYAERAVWMAAGIALVVGGMLALRVREPRTSGSPQAVAPPRTSAERLPACADSHVAAASRTSTAASERIYSISELPIESSATAQRSPAVQAIAVAAPVGRKRRATAKSGSTTELASPGAQSAEGGPTTASEPPPLARTLDADAARRALDAAARRARLCADQGARGSVVVTINGAGRAQNVSLSSTVGSHDACLLGAFGQVRVPPFSGPPVTVRKSFAIE